ncbi:DUF998 domain-containing protein [Amycolatopsis magusensis]|uniref:Membrane protein n=1 Tax=Amycolatopsis magusensis TaxID=882444 RepID=A0ABS4PT50_9PSEU|nr:DUF998 domain-containing protein [Amycolatopsis magusensis]MBP2182605.1 putative membrane protein [Amycolatopsis magusensis]
MTTSLPTRAGTTSTAAELTADRVTKSLLGYGVLAGPVYVVAALVQSAFRDGFDLTRHAWSQLAVGDFGWMQVTNLVVTGLMVLAFAAGLRRALRTGPAASWAPALIGVFGVSMVVAGAFPVDALGTESMSTSALIHFAAGGIGFPCLAAGLLVLARRLSREGFARHALATRIIAPLFLLSFVGMASGALGILAFVAGVVGVFGLVAVLAVHRYRQMPDTDG